MTVLALYVIEEIAARRLSQLGAAEVGHQTYRFDYAGSMDSLRLYLDAVLPRGTEMCLIELMDYVRFSAAGPPAVYLS